MLDSGHEGLCLVLPACIYFPSSANTPALPENPPLLLISVLVAPLVTLSWLKGGPVNQSWPLSWAWPQVELHGD